MTSERVEAVLTGVSKRRTGFTQDEVAELFTHGRDEYGTENLKSHRGILTHYSTIEAIRLENGTVIDNTQCWSEGWAHCPYVQSQIALPLTHLEAWFNKIGVREDLSCMTVKTISVEKPEAYLVELEDKHIAIRKREYPSHWDWLFKIGDTIEAMKQMSCGNAAVKIFATDGDIEAEEKRLNELEEKQRERAAARKKELYRPIFNAKEILDELGIRIKVGRDRWWGPRWVRTENVNDKEIPVDPYLSLPRAGDLIVKEVLRGLDGNIVAKILIAEKDRHSYHSLMTVCLMGKDQSGPWVHFLPRLAISWGLAACDRWLLQMEPGDILVASS